VHQRRNLITKNGVRSSGKPLSTREEKDGKSEARHVERSLGQKTFSEEHHEIIGKKTLMGKTIPEKRKYRGNKPFHWRGDCSLSSE